MQTFLPYPCFRRSAATLDYRRLGKQRIEAKQIYKTLVGSSKGWSNHPAVLMWRGFETYLLCYGATICSEWIKRGYKDQQLSWFYDRIHCRKTLVRPWWLGKKRFHASHRGALLAKDPEWYGAFGWKEIPRVKYYWPVE